MREEYGRSLVEIIGVMAIAGVMTVSALGVYNMMRQNQIRTIASTELKQIAQDTKILMEARGSYEGVSVNYLIKAGALQSDKAPIGGNNWSVEPTFDGTYFSINLTDLSSGECDYFTTTSNNWASAIIVNGYEFDGSDRCFSSGTNQISFIVK